MAFFLYIANLHLLLTSQMDDLKKIKITEYL